VRESTIERRLFQQAKRAGWWPLKFTSPSRRGVPDRLLLGPGGVTVFVELKAPGKKPTRQQAAVHRRMRRLQHTVLVIDSLEAVDQLFALEDSDAV